MLSGPAIEFVSRVVVMVKPTILYQSSVKSPKGPSKNRTASLFHNLRALYPKYERLPLMISKRIAVLRKVDKKSLRVFFASFVDNDV